MGSVDSPSRPRRTAAAAVRSTTQGRKAHGSGELKKIPDLTLLPLLQRRWPKRQRSASFFQRLPTLQTMKPVQSQAQFHVAIEAFL